MKSVNLSFARFFGAGWASLLNSRETFRFAPVIELVIDEAVSAAWVGRVCGVRCWPGASRLVDCDIFVGDVTVYGRVW